jgi:hypothetical protein
MLPPATRVTTPLSWVAIVGHDEDGARELLSALSAVLDPREPVSDGGMMEMNYFPSLDRVSTTLRSAKRRYEFAVGSGAIPRLPPRAMDAAVLALSARRSVRTCTRERLLELRAHGPCPVVLLVTESEAPDAVADLPEIEARELLDATGFDGDSAEVVYAPATLERVGRDARWEVATRAIIEALDERARDAPDDESLPFAQRIDALRVGRQSATVRGTVLRGRATRGETLQQIVGDARYTVKVEALLGRGSLQVRGLTNDAEGSLLCAPDSIAPSRALRLRLFAARPWTEGILSSNVSLLGLGPATDATLSPVDPRPTAADIVDVIAALERPVSVLPCESLRVAWSDGFTSDAIVLEAELSPEEATSRSAPRG